MELEKNQDVFLRFKSDITTMKQAILDDLESAIDEDEDQYLVNNMMDAVYMLEELDSTLYDRRNGLFSWSYQENDNGKETKKFIQKQ